MTSETQNVPDQGRFHFRVAEEVRVLLARRQLSARELARMLDWSDNYISRRLTGKIPMDVNDLVAIARTLNVPLTSFFPRLDLDQESDGTLLGGGSITRKYYTPTASQGWKVPTRRIATRPLPLPAVSPLAA